MPPTVTIELAGEPVGQGRARFLRATGRAYTPAHTAKYRAALQVAASDAMAGRTPIDGGVAIGIFVSLPVPQSWSGKKQRAALAGEVLPVSRPDLDNYCKLAFDALNSVVFRDDSQIVDAWLSKRYSAKPSLRIEVTALEPVALAAREGGSGHAYAAIARAAA